MTEKRNGLGSARAVFFAFFYFLGGGLRDITWFLADFLGDF